MKATVNEIKEIIKESGTLSNIEDLEESTLFSDAGIDSLEVFTILLGVEEKYDIKIPDDESYDFNTIGSVIVYLDSLSC